MLEDALYLGISKHQFSLKSYLTVTNNDLISFSYCASTSTRVISPSDNIMRCRSRLAMVPKPWSTTVCACIFSISTMKLMSFAVFSVSRFTYPKRCCTDSNTVFNDVKSSAGLSRTQPLAYIGSGTHARALPCQRMRVMSSAKIIAMPLGSPASDTKLM